MKSMATNPVLGALSAYLLISLANSSFAGTLNYNGPFGDPNGMNGWADPNNGGTVWYAGVSESNGLPADPALPLFGAPASINGNQIDFNPQGFNAQSSGDDSQITDSQLSFMIIAMDGQVIDNVQFFEAGDTTLAALSGSAFTSVTMNMFIDVVEIDGNTASGGISTIIGQMVFTPSDGDYAINVPTFTDDGFPFYSTDWTGELFIDIHDELDAQNISYKFGATKLNVTVDNTLTAISAGGGSAFIAKKDADGLTVTSNIPEPATLILMLGGVLCGIVPRRRS